MHNYMIFLRGSPEIYDSWDYDGEYVVSTEYAQVDIMWFYQSKHFFCARTGTWSHEVLFKVFREIETNLMPHTNPALHGTDGPCYVSSLAPYSPRAAELFTAAANKSGHPIARDFNGESLLGFGPFPTSTVNGTRWSAGWVRGGVM